LLLAKHKTYKRMLFPKRSSNEGENNENRCAIKLTTQDRKFLLDVYEHPTYSVTQHYSSVGLSARKGNEIQRILLNNGLLAYANISVGRKIIKILGLTEKGREALGVKTPSAREGGVVHTYWKHSIAEHLRICGYEVTEEYPAGDGKTIDLVAMKNGKRIAFEIETGNSEAVDNIKKCLGNGVDMVFVIATSHEAVGTFAATLPKQPEIKLMTGSEAIGMFKSGVPSR
jgi:hypothetical protein